MAERNFDVVRAIGRNKYVISGSFATRTGAGAVSGVKGLGFSVAYVSTGLYRLTLENSYVDMQSAVVSIQQPAADDKFAMVASAYSVANRTLDIAIEDVSGGTVVDPTDNAASRVNFVLVMDDALQV